MTYLHTALSLDDALRIIQAGIVHAERIGVAATVVVTDDSGKVKASARMDGASLASLQVAGDKSYSSASTGVPTADWYEIALDDPSFGFGLSAVERLCAIGGGLPLMVDGALVGAVGVSGGSVAEDVAIAEAAAADLIVVG